MSETFAVMASMAEKDRLRIAELEREVSIEKKYRQRFAKDLSDKCDQLEKAMDELEKLRDAQRWIPVGERLPDSRVCEDVIVAAKLDGIVDREVCYWYGDYFSETLGTITHWMPLPKPPQEAGE